MRCSYTVAVSDMLLFMQAFLLTGHAQMNVTHQGRHHR